MGVKYVDARTHMMMVVLIEVYREVRCFIVVYYQLLFGLIRFLVAKEISIYICICLVVLMIMDELCGHCLVVR